MSKKWHEDNLEYFSIVQFKLKQYEPGWCSTCKYKNTFDIEGYCNSLCFYKYYDDANFKVWKANDDKLKLEYYKLKENTK